MPPPPHDSKILYYLNNRDEGRYYLCRILAPCPDATILNYPNDREMGAPLSFVGFWRPPPPQSPQYLTTLLTERGGRALLFIRFGTPNNPPPPPPTPQYLTILMTERGGAPLSFVRFWRPPPPSPDATTLNDLSKDREMRGFLSLSCKKLNI